VVTTNSQIDHFFTFKVVITVNYISIALLGAEWHGTTLENYVDIRVYVHQSNMFTNKY